jgi:hypothetical protein
MYDCFFSKIVLNYIIGSKKIVTINLFVDAMFFKFLKLKLICIPDAHHSFVAVIKNASISRWRLQYHSKCNVMLI